MVKTYDISEAIWIEVEGTKWHICPDCKDHTRGEPMDLYDCKNIFTRDGEVLGQCMCYSEAHGRRE